MDAHGLIALAMISAFVILCVATMYFTRGNVDQTVKILTVFVGLFGTAFGAMATYYFTKSELTVARAETALYKARLTVVSAAADRVVSTLNTTPTEIKLGDFRETPRYQNAVQGLDAAKVAPLTLKASPTEIWGEGPETYRKPRQ